MIIGIGNDLVDIRRIEKALKRHGRRFEERCFTAAERSKAERRRASGLHIEVFAKRFAAKEACAKALGTGFSENVFLKDIGVVEDQTGRPFLELTGGALDRLNALIPQGKRPVLHLSLSDEPPMAQAFVIIEAV
ncbi:MAG: holo-ACP synthase [Alphaproteobacteria bacterium]|nr:holo-ACP synthase [Alphaproteobacteria bacterium]MCB1840979.1 holo-ACP synthase [Alphaproteobacteria bacterium]